MEHRFSVENYSAEYFDLRNKINILLVFFTHYDIVPVMQDDIACVLGT